MKIALISTQGGHLTEMLQLLDAFESHNIFFVTHPSIRDTELASIAPVYLIAHIGTNPYRLFLALFSSHRILKKEKPDIILSLGAEIALPFFFWGKILKIKTIFIESWCRLESLSRTGKLSYHIVDVFLVQWPQLLKVCGPKAHYEGAVI